MTESLKRCIRCKSSYAQLECQPDIEAEIIAHTKRHIIYIYCEKCEIRTKDYMSDRFGGTVDNAITEACNAAIEDWNKEF